MGHARCMREFGPVKLSSNSKKSSPIFVMAGGMKGESVLLRLSTPEL